jgi:hypothetical protein
MPALDQVDVVLLPLSPRSKEPQHPAKVSSATNDDTQAPTTQSESTAGPEKKPSIDVSLVGRQLDMLLIQQEKEEWNRKVCIFCFLLFFSLCLFDLFVCLFVRFDLFDFFSSCYWFLPVCLIDCLICY